MSRLLRYIWAAPYSLLGCLLALLPLLCGARVTRVDGTLEIGGGRIGRLLAHRRHAAVTFGHVILGTDAATLAALRAHERVHVRQYERWGPLFVPLYLAAGLREWLGGRHPYRHNCFEREAFAGQAPAAPARPAMPAAAGSCPPCRNSRPGPPE